MSAENHKWSILTAVLFLALLSITALNARPSNRRRRGLIQAQRRHVLGGTQQPLLLG